jgi:predicted AAA+ superfamily ATPase
MLIQRSEYTVLANRVAEDRKFIQVVVGPRQIGKTTLIQQVLAAQKIPFISISADSIAASNSLWIEQQWEAARIQLKNSGATSFLLAIDEIQKINNWAEVVKKNWDADTIAGIDIRLIISGSSKLLIQDGLTESLAGRFELIRMTHWSFSEMQEAFDFTEEQFAFFGAYPAAAALIKDEQRWRTYITDSLVETTITKDILLITRIDKPALLKQLFELGCTYSTQQVSYNKLLGQLQNAGNTTTLANYLNLLDAANLLTGLPKYAASKVSSKNSSPKLQVYNNAFFTVYNSISFAAAQANPAEWGRWVENIIGCHLLNSSIKNDYELFYWRHGNDEVDFIIKKQNKLIGIEVKSGNRLKSSGLEKANKQLHFYKTFLTGVEGMNWKDFLRINPATLFE